MVAPQRVVMRVRQICKYIALCLMAHTLFGDDCGVISQETSRQLALDVHDKFGFAPNTPVVLKTAAESVDTSMAGFAGFRPHPPGGRTAIPAARRYAPAVSRRICAALSMRRNDHPSRPNAMTCCFFSSLKTLLT